MKLEALVVYAALGVAVIFVIIAIYATLKAGSNEDDQMGYDESET